MFIAIPSLEELSTKANEVSSPLGVRLFPAGHQAGISSLFRSVGLGVNK